MFDQLFALNFSTLSSVVISTSFGDEIMVESLVCMLTPTFGTCTGFEMSCIGAGVFFSALYILALGLWFASNN